MGGDLRRGRRLRCDDNNAYHSTCRRRPMPRVLLIALDSVGIDPLGHDRPESVYSHSRFLFSRKAAGDPVPLPDAPVPAVLIETNVAGPDDRGAIECAV